MQRINDKKCLASWAVFKRFGENEHKNRYDILREFIKATIFKHSLRTFTVASLTDNVNEDYAFNLKAAVVAYAIQQLQFKRDSFGTYEANPEDFAEQKVILDDIDNESAESNKVLQQLFSYVENNNGVSLIDSEKNELVQSFINYILDNSYSDKYATEISSFVLKYKEGNSISVPLDSILEGVVRYVGVTYDTPTSASSRWTTELYVYLDTELLFHMAGYNGIIYKTLFDDFYSFVEEINNDSINNGGKKKIHLRYFPETEEEIDTFFEKAKEIVNNKIRRNPFVAAMKAITDGCSSDSDIDEKRGLFESLVKSRGINKDTNPVDFYSESNYTLNIEDQKIIDDFIKNNPRTKFKDVRNSLISLSHVNVLRKGHSNKSFENIKYVLLTDNFITKKLSRVPDIRKDGDKPLSTDLYYITNRMWNRLGKAFGNSVTPKVFDVVCKAKIILSGQINSSVSSKYEELVQKMDSDEISPDEAIEVVYQLRKEVRNPEELDSQDAVDEALVAITENDIAKYAEERDYQEQQHKKIQAENRHLRKENEQITAKINEVKRENENVKAEIQKVKTENQRVIKDNQQLSSEIKDTNKRVDELQKSLTESLEREKSVANLLYNKELKDFCSKKKRQAWWTLALLVFLIVASIILDWLTEKYHWQFFPHVLQRILTYVIPLIIYLCRASIVKINPVRMIKIILGGDRERLKAEFDKEWNN